MKKVVILIDGQNLFYSLKNLGFNESQIKWGGLLTSFIESGDELVRTYWFRPNKLHYTQVNEYKLINFIINRDHRQNKTRYLEDRTTIPLTIIDQAKTELASIESWLKEKENLFQKQELKYEQLCIDYDNVQIVKSGFVKLNSFRKEWVGEKGVDVSLAVKMIEFSERCDKIILVSGDYDYAEAINYVKAKFKTIHIVKFNKGYPPKNKNMSRSLTALADKIINVYESDLRATYLK